MEFLAKGKRGIVYKEKNEVVKCPHPKSHAINNLKIESEFLKKLNKKNIGPKFIRFANNNLHMEYIDGERILDYLAHNQKKEILSVIKNVLEQCYILDNLKINKKEMTNPYKHIIVQKGKPILIDFERCRYSEKPHNVTQFLQFLVSQKMLLILHKKKINLEKNAVKSLGEEYTHSKNLSNILKILQ